jgi:hypothetical protein
MEINYEKFPWAKDPVVQHIWEILKRNARLGCASEPATKVDEYCTEYLPIIHIGNYIKATDSYPAGVFLCQWGVAAFVNDRRAPGVYQRVIKRILGNAAKLLGRTRGGACANYADVADALMHNTESSVKVVWRVTEE